jgi:hypothetical protein
MQIKRGSWQSIVNSFALLPFLFLFFVCGVLFRRQRDKSLSGSSFHSLSLSPNEKQKNKKQNQAPSLPITPSTSSTSSNI